MSLLWKAAISSRSEYSQIVLTPDIEEEMRKCLFNQKIIKPMLVSIKISRLYDKNPNGFAFDYFKGSLYSPFHRKYKKYFSFCFILKGFFIEFFLGLHYKDRKRLRVINPNEEIIVAPYLDYNDVPELIQCMVAGYRKNVEGKVRIKSI